MRNDRIRNINQKSGEKEAGFRGDRLLKRRMLDGAVVAALASLLVAAADADAQTFTVTSGPFANSGFQNVYVPAGVIVAGNPNAVFNNLPLTSFINNGRIIGVDSGMLQTNGGVIATLTNNGLIEGGPSNVVGIALNNNPGNGVIQVLNNNGTIHSVGSTAVNNSGSIGTINNGASGLIYAEPASNAAIYSANTINSINNAGTIKGATGIYAGGAGVGTINNSGLIQALTGDSALQLAVAPVGGLNNSGTILASANDLFAIDSYTGNLVINNSGVIAGGIRDFSGNAITINGGSGETFGTLTGVGTIGNIPLTGNQATVIFGTGNLVLNDNIIGNSSSPVVNRGATIRIAEPITITGSSAGYQQRAAGALQFVVGGPSNASLTVMGPTVLASGSQIALLTLSKYPFAKGQRYVVIHSAGATNYDPAALKYVVLGYGAASGSIVPDSANASHKDLVVEVGDPTPTFATDQNGHLVPVPVTPTNPVNPIKPGPNTDVIKKLEDYKGTDPGINDIRNVIIPQDDDTRKKSAEDLSPTAVMQSAVAVNSAATNAVIGLATTHLDNLRGGFGDASSSDDGSTSGDGSGSGNGNRQGGRDEALWGQVFGGHVIQGERDYTSGYHANYGGLVIGGDTRLNGGLRAGGLFSYARIRANSDGNSDGSSATVDSYGLFAYGDYTGDPWYLTVMAGVSKQRYNTTRVINFPYFYGVADGSFNGLQMTTAAQFGYPLTVAPATRLTPVAGFVYSAQRENGYTEGGGNGAALSVNASSATSLKSDLGVKLDQTVETSYGKLQPAAQLRWRHEFHNSPMRTNATFAADSTGTTNFTSYGPSPIKDTGVLVLGASLLRSRNFTVSANYTLEAGAGYKAHAGDVRMRWQF